MTEISDLNKSNQHLRKKKKSFWFEFAEEKGVNPHKSAWSEYVTDNKGVHESTKYKIRYCRKCGNSIQPDAKFCERCGQRIIAR